MLGTLDNSSDVVMKAVVICDDIVFAAKADSVLRSIGARRDVKVVWEVKCWPLNALTDATLGAKVLAESLDAHLLVLPAIYAGSIPKSLFDWLKRWAEQRQICDAGLGFIAEGNGVALEQPVSPELSIFIRQHGLHLIMGQCPTKEAVMKAVSASSPHAEKSAPVGQARFEQPPTHQSYRGMGIND